MLRGIGFKLNVHFTDMNSLNMGQMIFQFPLLMASRMDKWGWQMPYASYFGGVGAMTTEQFEQVKDGFAVGTNFSF